MTPNVRQLTHFEAVVHVDPARPIIDQVQAAHYALLSRWGRGPRGMHFTEAKAGPVLFDALVYALRVRMTYADGPTRQGREPAPHEYVPEVRIGGLRITPDRAFGRDPYTVVFYTETTTYVIPEPPDKDGALGCYELPPHMRGLH